MVFPIKLVPWRGRPTAPDLAGERTVSLPCLGLGALLLAVGAVVTRQLLLRCHEGDVAACGKGVKALGDPAGAPLLLHRAWQWLRGGIIGRCRRGLALVGGTRGASVAGLGLARVQLQPRDPCIQTCCGAP